MLSTLPILVGVGLAIVSLCAMVCAFVQYHRTRALRQIPVYDLLVFLDKVDVRGLRALIDPMEEAFLRQSHSRTKFDEIQKDRIQFALAYLRRIEKNAIALQTFGYRHVSQGDDTKRFLAYQLINLAVPVRWFARGGICLLHIWKTLRFLRFVLISLSLPDLKDLVEELLASYQELKEAAAVFAIYSEPGTETKLFRSL